LVKITMAVVGGTMTDVPTPHRYELLAAELERRIQDGRLPPGAPLPSESILIGEFAVSRGTVREAVRHLRNVGLVVTEQGRGTFVRPDIAPKVESRRSGRSMRPLVREAHGRSMRRSSAAGLTSPFARDAAQAGRSGSWQHSSEHVTADADIAARLEIAAGDPIMRARYLYLAGDEPVQIAVSSEPLELTAGTPVEWPEECGIAGVVARFDEIRIRIDECVERVRDRPAAPEEILELALQEERAHVQTIERTYYASGRPVETATIVFPAGRYELVYRFPID
jgi:DNA-binding GntR family transcriptional regulator